MKWPEIRATARHLWEFLWPPVLLLWLSILIIQWIAPADIASPLQSLFDFLKLHEGSIDVFRQLLEKYGLSAVFLTLTTVTGLLIIYFIGAPILSLCASLPPHIITYPAYVLNIASDKEKHLLVRKYPYCRNPEEAIGFEFNNLLSDSDYQSSKYSTVTVYFKLLSISKFCALACVICSIWLYFWTDTSFLEILARAFIVLVLCVIAWLVTLPFYLSSMMDELLRDWSRIRNNIHQISLKEEIGEPSETERKKISNKLGQLSWWTLRLLGNGRFQYYLSLLRGNPWQ